MSRMQNSRVLQFTLILIYLLSSFSLTAGTFFYGKNILDKPGKTLLEVLPLMEEVYEMQISSESGIFVITGDDLAGEWGEARLISRNNSLTLDFRNIFYDSLLSLSVRGDKIKTDQLEIWINWEGTDLLKKEIDSFSRIHSLNTKVLNVPSTDSKLLSVSRARGKVPDLVMIQGSSVQKLVDNKVLQSLDYLNLPHQLSHGRQAFSLNGRQWAVPFYFDTQLLYYNKNLLPFIDTGNWNFHAFEAAAAVLRRKTEYPVVWNAYSSNFYIPFQKAFGKKSLIESNGRVKVNDTSSVQALEYIQALIDKDLLVPMERDAMDSLFVSGKAGMIMAGSYSISYYQSLSVPLGVLPLPVNEKTGKQASSLLDFKGFCMTRKTRVPVLARRMLQYLYSRKTQTRFSSSVAKLPVRSDISYAEGEGPAFYSEMKATVCEGTVIPPQAIYKVYKNNMWKLLRFSLSGKMTPRDTLDRGQKLMESIEK